MRGLAAFVLLGWLGLAILAWTKAPHAFAFGSLRFVLYDVLPVGLAGVAAVGLAGLRWPRVSRGALEVFAAACLIAAPGCALCFTESRPVLSIGFALIGLVTLLAAAALFRTPIPRSTRIALLTLGTVSGAIVGPALRAPDASTHPVGGDVRIPNDPPGDSATVAAEGVMRVDEQHWRLEIDPFFTVQSRSPDRYWTLFAPPHTRHRTRWQREGRAVDETTRTWWRSGDGLAEVAWSPGPPMRLDAVFVIPEPIFTHLATWSRVRFHADAAHVRFSPCGGVAIDVFPSDYPEGRPARFAYLADDARFVVVEAMTGEKGPFTTLCEGPLARDDTLTIELIGNRAHVWIQLLDFASQASTEPSPTAGWGVTQNAIQLLRVGNRPEGAVYLHLALAATGVGRGWDTVGLAPGSYRNRMRVRWDSPEPEQDTVRGTAAWPTRSTPDPSHTP